MAARTNEPFRGLCLIQLDDGLGNRRSWTVSITDVTPDTADGDQADWEGTAGGSVTLRFETDTAGAAPPGAAETITVEMRLKNGGAQVGATDWNPTASGETLTMHFDDNPLNASLGSARAGMLEIYMRVQRTSVVAYDVDSRGAISTPPAGFTHEWARGYLRAPVVLSAESLSNIGIGSAEPASFAFPDPIYQRLTLGATLYEANAVTRRLRQSGVNRRSNTGSSTTSTTRDFSLTATATGEANSGRFNRDFTSGNVDVRLELTADNFGGDNAFVWASAGHTGGYTRSSELILDDAARFTGDPAISLSNFASTQSLFNREETATLTWNILNARNEQVSTSMNRRVENSSGTSEASGSGSGPNYSFSHTVPSAGKATNDLVGDQWVMETEATDSATLSSNAYKVSRKWQFSTRGDGVIDNMVFVGKTATPLSDLISVRNRGQTVYFNAYVYNARGELLGNQIGNFGARWTDDETQVTGSASFTLTSGQIAGSSAFITHSSTHSPGGFALVFGGKTINSTNQPRTGTGGSGNFAETTTAEATTPDSSSHARTLTVKGRTDMYGPPLRFDAGYTFDFEGTDRDDNTSAVDCGAFGISGVGSAGAFCVECMFRADTLSGFRGLVTHNTGGTAETMNFYLGCNGTKLIGIVADAASGSDKRITGTTTLQTGVTYRAALDYDGTTLRLWLRKGSADATLEGTLAISQILNNVASAKVYIGRRDDNTSTEPWDGLIGAVRISSVSRYSSSFAPADSAFVSDANTLLLPSFASITGGAEWNLSQWYDLEVRTQKESTLNADSEDTQHTIGEDVVYAYADELNDQTGDPVSGVSLEFRQYDPSDVQSNTTASQTTDANGETAAVRMDAKAPKGSGWRVELKTASTHNGNSALGDQLNSMVSAFTADKNISIYIVPERNASRHLLEREPIHLCMSYYVKGVRTSPDASPVPKFSITKTDHGNDQVLFLQADGTFSASGHPVFFDAHESATQPGTWHAMVGPGGDLNIAMTNFTPGKYNVLAVLFKDTQEFRDDEDFEIVGPHAVHELDAA